MLRALPFSTFGDIAALRLEVHVYCAGCKTYRQLQPGDARVRDRCFAGAPLRWSACDGPGFPKIRPAELLPIGGAVTLAFLFCRRCAWEIDQAQLHQLPWSASGLTRGDRFRCPGCNGRVDWHIHGPTWRPSYEEVRPPSSPAAT
jgi:hypothetical protein